MRILRHAILVCAFLFPPALPDGPFAARAEDAGSGFPPEPAMPADAGMEEAGEQKSLADAAELLRKATDEYAATLLASPPEGMSGGDVAFALGNLYALGVLGFPEDGKAKEYLELALEKGVPEAGVALGAMYFETGGEDHDHDGDGIQDHQVGATGTEADIGKALDFYRTAAGAGSVDGMRILGRLFMDGDNGVAPDREEGEKYLLDAARYGDEYALSRLEGKFAEAAEWEKAHPGKKAAFPASRGEAVDPALSAKRQARNERMAASINTVYSGMEKALFQAMGMDYDAMEKQKRRQAEFLAVFDRVAEETAASRPDPRDQAETAFAIGAIYSFGMAGGVNLDQAEKYYRMAGEKGMDEAWAAIAELYAGGVPDMDFMARENSAKALDYYRESADKGVARAMYALGTLYQAGRKDLPADAVKALAFFRQAAEWGDEDAVAAIDALIADMPEAERGAKGLPAEARELIDPAKAEKTAARLASVHAAFERTEQILRERLEEALRKLDEPEGVTE